MGPCIRINRNGDQPQGIAQILDFIGERVPGQALNDSRTKLFTLFFGENSEVRARQQSASKMQTPTIPQIHADSAEALTSRSWVDAIHAFARTQNFDYNDALYIADTSIWGVLYLKPDPLFVGLLNDILSTQLNLYLMSNGSYIAQTKEEAFITKTWRPTTAQIEKTEEWDKESYFWLTTYRQQYEIEDQTENNRQYRHQRQAELTLWNFALEKIVAVMSKHSLNGQYVEELTLADSIRAELPPQLAGYLACTLVNEQFIHHLMFHASTSLQASVQSLNALEYLGQRERPDARYLEDPPIIVPLQAENFSDFNTLNEKILADNSFELQDTNFDLAQAEINRFAELVMGNCRQQAPQWQRIRALEILCATLEQFAVAAPQENLHAVLAWIHWFKGNSTVAGQYLELDPKPQRNLALPIEMALEINALPYWCHTEKSWAHYNYHSK